MTPYDQAGFSSSALRSSDLFGLFCWNKRCENTQPPKRTPLTVKYKLGQCVFLVEVRSLSLECKCLISSSGQAASNRLDCLLARMHPTQVFMNDAKATLYHLRIHYQILKTALYVSLSSVRITDAPILATCPGGNVESVIKAGTVYWIARAFYKPVSDRKTHKQRCGPTEGSKCNNTKATYKHAQTHTCMHTFVLLCLWGKEKSHFLSYNPWN